MQLLGKNWLPCTSWYYLYFQLETVKKTTENLSKYSVYSSKIQTNYFLKTSQECYCYTSQDFYTENNISLIILKMQKSNGGKS